MPAKLFPAPVARRKNPPPPAALAELKKTRTCMEIQPQVDILKDGVVLHFSEEINFLLMTARGARILAASLINHADVLEATNE